MAGGTGLIKRFYNEVIMGGDFSLIDELVLNDYVTTRNACPGSRRARRA